jgi:hypothetical protein
MLYILGNNRRQVRIYCIEDYIDDDCELRVIDKIINVLDIEYLGFKIGNNDIIRRLMFDPKDIPKLFVYVYSNVIKNFHISLQSKRKLIDKLFGCLMNYSLNIES